MTGSLLGAWLADRYGRRAMLLGIGVLYLVSALWQLTRLFQFNIVFGILVAYVSNSWLRSVGGEDWRWMLGVAERPVV